MPATTITSRRHALVARCRDAADGTGDEVLLDGAHLVGDALAADVPLAGILVAEGVAERPEMQRLLQRARAAGVVVHHVTPAVLDAASPTRTPAGIVALASLRFHPLDDLLQRPPALVTVTLGIQDPGNVGTLVRSSEAAGATGLLALPGTAHPFGWKALRGSMGSALRLPICRAGDTRQALADLQHRGVTIVALRADAEVPFTDADLTGPLAVCAGAEGAGLPSDVLATCDLHLSIPMRPPVESLNVAVATSLVLFEAPRQRRGRPVRREGGPS